MRTLFRRPIAENYYDGMDARAVRSSHAWGIAGAAPSNRASAVDEEEERERQRTMSKKEYKKKMKVLSLLTFLENLRM